jgi:CHAD domain-containing protein
MRTVWNVEYRHSRIEVALDRGRIEGGRDRQRVAVPVAELELELKDGRPEDLIAAALQLAGRGKAALALVPMLRGKAERGYRLVSGTPAPPTKASAPGFTAALRPETSSPAALRAIVAHGLDVLLANTEALRDVHAPEYVHQARVALRRMRSAVRLLDRKHEDFPATLATELRWAARLLGAARDADVLALQTLPRLLAETPRQLGSGVKKTLQRARAKQEVARRRVLAAMDTSRYARLALRLQAWSMTSPPKGRTLERLAPQALDRARRRLFGAADGFVELSPEDRHRVRILAKRLRYTLDVLSVALPPGATKQYVNALADLQDVLGEFNDGAVALGALGSLTDDRAIRGLAVARLEKSGTDLAAAGVARLRELQEAPMPWKSERGD